VSTWFCGSPEKTTAPATEPTTVEGRLHLDFVVTEGAAVLEILPREEEALLVRVDALLDLNLLLDHLDLVVGLVLQTKRFTRLSYSGLVVELEHLKIETRLTNEKLASVKGECEI
jgi:hypothetical protein